MSRSQIKRYAPGDVVGNCTIISLTADANTYSQRIYAVRLDCCGKTTEKTQKFIRDADRHHHKQCQTCAARAKRLAGAPLRGMPIVVGTVAGPVTVIGLGPDTQHKRVIWSCCGRAEVVNNRVIYRLRQAGKLVTWQMRCQPCYAKERASHAKQAPRIRDMQVTLSTMGMISAAIAWPRPGVA